MNPDKDLRDMLGETAASAGGDAMGKAQKLMRPPLPKRFYKKSGIRQEQEGHAVLLDGKPVRTPAKRLLILPTADLARDVAEEFDAQQTEIDPATMPLTRLANTAIDGVADAMEAVIEDIQRFASSDMVCYRAGDPQGLVDEQNRHWDPVIDWALSALGARFVLAEGVMHVEQPRTAIAAVGVEAARAQDSLRLAALHTVTTLTGSALIALALAAGAISAEEAWTAAHVDEDWNIALWGEDAEASARRAAREKEFRAAARVMEAFQV